MKIELAPGAENNAFAQMLAELVTREWGDFDAARSGVALELREQRA